jgi:hypothetical protein
MPRWIHFFKYLEQPKKEFLNVSFSFVEKFRLKSIVLQFCNWIFLCLDLFLRKLLLFFLILDRSKSISIVTFAKNLGFKKINCFRIKKSSGKVWPYTFYFGLNKKHSKVIICCWLKSIYDFNYYMDFPFHKSLTFELVLDKGKFYSQICTSQ